ncbi:hypothetical protein [Nocardioides sp.]|uniref:hypothetical protein n=1 Tax=Nocardioides sp. TaxID=35761 RepID=UPI0039E344D1
MREHIVERHAGAVRPARMVSVNIEAGEFFTSLIELVERAPHVVSVAVIEIEVTAHLG